MAQQTSVEWLIEQLMERDFIKKNYEIFEKAKAMEKEQIIDAYWNGTIDISKEQALSEAEDFYNSYYNI
jgi:hypothetical protein